MPTFYFDFLDGDRAARDEEGHTLPSREAARAEALRALVEIYALEPRDVDSRRVCCDVRGDEGALVFRASLTLHAEREPKT